MEICFASHNENKVKEIRSILPSGITLKSLNQIGISNEIVEDGKTIEENSAIKARYVYTNFGLSCISDDTGLEVKSLNGDPGVYSARYAGPQKDVEANMDLLLANLAPKLDRSAQFKTVITYIDEDGSEFAFEGIVKGQIVEKRRGTNGFGYDPIFLPDGYKETFAEMELSEKNKISHRARAFDKLVEFFKKRDQ